MTNSQRLSLVRQCLRLWLADNALDDHLPGDTQTDLAGADAKQAGSTGPTPPQAIQESILIRDGFYCGRRFDAGTHEAVWFMEEDELKISDLTGDLLCVYVGEEIGAAVHAAQAPILQAPVTEIAIAEVSTNATDVDNPSDDSEAADRQDVISIADHRLDDRQDEASEEIRRAA